MGHMKTGGRPHLVYSVNGHWLIVTAQYWSEGFQMWLTQKKQARMFCPWCRVREFSCSYFFMLRGSWVDNLHELGTAELLTLCFPTLSKLGSLSGNPGDE